MKNLNLLIIFIFSLASFSCKNDVTDISLDYNEKLVLNGILTAGKPITNIYLSRTLPPLEEFDMTKAIISDAELKIHTGTTEYKLHYNKNGYYDTDSIIALSGTEYTITVNWNGKRLSGKTTIPDPTPINRVFIDSNIQDNGHNKTILYNFTLEFLPQNNKAYLPGYILKRYYPGWKDTLAEVYYKYGTGYLSSENNIQKTTLSFYAISSFYPPSPYFFEYMKDEKLSAFLETFDPQFYNYWKTSSNYSSTSDPFSFTSGRNMRGNLTGDGFGLFIGRAVTTKDANELIDIFKNKPK